MLNPSDCFPMNPYILFINSTVYLHAVASPYHQIHALQSQEGVIGDKKLYSRFCKLFFCEFPYLALSVWHKAVGLVHQWNAKRTVPKPHHTVHFVSSNHFFQLVLFQ